MKHKRSYITPADRPDKKPFDRMIGGEENPEYLRYQEYWNTGIWDPRWQDDDYYNMRWEAANGPDDEYEAGESEESVPGERARNRWRRKEREAILREEGYDVDHPDWVEKLDELDEWDREDELQEEFDEYGEYDEDNGC